jgi:hypothetical protein
MSETYHNYVLKPVFICGCFSFSSSLINWFTSSILQKQNFFLILTWGACNVCFAAKNICKEKAFAYLANKSCFTVYCANRSAPSFLIWLYILQLCSLYVFKWLGSSYMNLLVVIKRHQNRILVYDTYVTTCFCDKIIMHRFSLAHRVWINARYAYLRMIKRRNHMYTSC